jgi:hypothetical protein
VLTESHTQECLSLAYVHAVTGLAGVNLEVKLRHDYGVDGTFRPVVNSDGRRVESGHNVDFQLKSSVKWEHDGDAVMYDLEAKTYNDMVGRAASAIPLILLLLCLPRNSATWLAPTETELILRHCCYWMKLSGEPTDNIATKRIRIPRSNLLTPAAVLAILATERDRWQGAS